MRRANEYEADCGHSECTASLRSEIVRDAGERWTVAEIDLCLVRERAEDARGEAAYGDNYGEDNRR